MIRYALACSKGHTFESWFQNSAAYDKQAKRGLVECPVCGDAKVEKALMAPKLSGTKKRARAVGAGCDARAGSPSAAPAASEAPTPVAMISPQEREFRTKLKELRDHLTKNADNVGQKVSRRSAQDALRRDRAPLDLRRGLAGGSQGHARGRHRIPSAAGAARRAKLALLSRTFVEGGQRRGCTSGSAKHTGEAPCPPSPQLMSEWPCGHGAAPPGLRGMCTCPRLCPPYECRVRWLIRPHQRRDPDHDQHDADAPRAAWSPA